MDDVLSTDMEGKKKFAARLREVRDARALTLAELSRRSGITVRRVMALEAAEGDEVGPGELIPLATALWVPLAELITPTLSAKALIFAVELDESSKHAEVLSFLRIALKFGVRFVCRGRNAVH